MKMALKDHMTRKLVTIASDASIAEAHRLMTNFRIRHLPVLDDQEQFVIGMVSENELPPQAAELTDMPVRPLMTTPIKTLDIDTPLKSVVTAMIKEHVSAYLVTKQDEIVGIVTTEDMMTLLAEMLNKEDNSLWNLSQIFTSPSLQKAAYLVGQTGV